jgi:DNA modification methylase
MSRLIKIDVNNFNKHTEDGEKLLEKSVREVGVIESITTDINGEIVTGNARKKVFDKLGLKPKFIKLKEDEYPVIETELDGEQRVKAAILANTVAEKNINLDVELIKEVAVNQLDIDIEELGIDSVRVPGKGTWKQSNLTDEDFNEDEEIKTDIVSGDIIEIGRHRLICGDSTDLQTFERVLNGKKIDCVFTSPPYNAGRDKMKSGNYSGKEKQFYKGKNTDNKTSEEYKDFLISVLNNIHCNLSETNSVFWNISYNSKSRDDYGKIIFSNENPLQVCETIIWDKGSAIMIAQHQILSRVCELIFLMSTGEQYLWNEITPAVNVWRILSRNCQQEGHRACFPIELPSKAIEDFTNENHLIFDCFMGSGTTMAASHLLNRTCYGIERIPEYCEMTVRRLLKIDSELEVRINGILRK